jgi:tetratricopeptide (TPR) repeat protein
MFCFSMPVDAQRQKGMQMMKIGDEVVSVKTGQMFVRAQEFISNGQWDHAACLLKTFLEAQPQSSAAHYKYGFVLLQQGKNTEALEHAKTCVKLSPAFFGGWSLLGEASMNLKLDAQAKEAYEKALTIQPGGENAEIIRERLKELAGQNEQPTQYIEDPQISEQNRKNMMVNEALSLCDKAKEHLKQKQFDQGLQECREALKIAPGSSEIKENFVVYLNNYAAVCVQTQNLKRAEELMQEAISFQAPGDITLQTRLTALKNYAALLNFLNRPGEAEKIDAEMKSLNTNHRECVK